MEDRINLIINLLNKMDIASDEAKYYIYRLFMNIKSLKDKDSFFKDLVDNLNPDTLEVEVVLVSI